MFDIRINDIDDSNSNFLYDFGVINDLRFNYRKRMSETSMLARLKLVKYNQEKVTCSLISAYFPSYSSKIPIQVKFSILQFFFQYMNNLTINKNNPFMKSK